MEGYQTESSSSALSRPATTKFVTEFKTVIYTVIRLRILSTKVRE